MRHRQDSVDPPAKSQQTLGIEAHKPRTLGLDSCSDRLETHQQPLPLISYADGVRRDERQLRASGK